MLPIIRQAKISFALYTPFDTDIAILHFRELNDENEK